MRRICQVLAVILIVAAVGVTGVSGERLAAVEFSFFPPQEDSLDVLLLIPQWLMEEMVEITEYDCVPVVYSYEELVRRRLLRKGEELAIRDLQKLGVQDDFDFVLIGTVTVVVGSGLVVTASLLDLETGVAIETGSLHTESLAIDEVRERAPELARSLIGLERSTASVPPVAEITVVTERIGLIHSPTALDLYLGEDVQLDATRSYDSDGEILSYEWDLDGDGEPDQYLVGVAALGLTEEAGQKQVTLTVTDNEGMRSTATLQAAVLPQSWEDVLRTENLKPVAIFRVRTAEGTPLERQAFLGEPLEYEASLSYDLDGQIVEYAWDLNGDGVADHKEQRFTTSLISGNAGSAHIVLTVTDNLGATGIAEQDLEICSMLYEEHLRSLNLPPIPVLDIHRASHLVSAAGGLYRVFLGEDVTLSASRSYDPDGEIVAYEWDLNADGRVNERRVEVRSQSLTSEPGQRVILLRLKDDLGAMSEEQVTIAVLDYPARDIVGHWLRAKAMPFLRGVLMVVLGLGLLAGVGYLIWYYGI